MKNANTSFRISALGAPPLATCGSMTIEQWPERLACVRAACACDFFRCPAGDDATTAPAAFGSEVYDEVSGFNNVKIMFDDDDSVAERDETLEHVQ